MGLNGHVFDDFDVRFERGPKGVILVVFDFIFLTCLSDNFV